MNLDHAARALREYLAADIPAFMWGAPGVGKSDAVHAVAAAEGLPLIDVRAVLLDPVDLRGLPTVVDGCASWAKPDFLPRADRDGAAGILFLDELNAAPASVQAACFQLVLNRRLGEYEMPAGWRIVAAGNRQSDRAAAQRMPSALANRFAHIDVEPSVAAWVQWAIGANVTPLVLAFIRFRPALLHLMPGQKPEDSTLPPIPSEAKAFPTPRAWASVAKVCGAPDDIRQWLVAGLVGEGPAAEFEGFARMFRGAPTIADIVANPTGAKVPSEPGMLYAVAAGLARAADRKTLAPILAYADRMPREFSIMLAVDAVKRDDGLKSTAAFVAWAGKNQDVTIGVAA